MEDLATYHEISTLSTMLFDPMKNKSMVYMNAEKNCIMRITLSYMPYEEYDWRVTEFSYDEHLTQEEVAQLFIDFMNMIVKELSDTSFYFYAKIEEHDKPRNIPQFGFLEQVKDDMYVSKYTR